jgi:hypothetical protein
MQGLTFYDLRSRHGGNLLRIACAAHVHTNIVLAMVLNLGVTEESARRVLGGFNEMHSTSYTLNDINVLIAQEDYFSQHGRMVAFEPWVDPKPKRRGRPLKSSISPSV